MSETIFSEPLHVGRPFAEESVKASYLKYMEGVFERNYFTNDGPLVREFESRIARIHDVGHCVAVSNATMGLMLVLKALGIEEGEVIMPSFTFIATAHSCLWQNLRPVFCDISPDTLMIDAEKIRGLFTQNTRALIGVHIFGNICDVDGLTRISRDNGLKLIFDSAHAFNCRLNGRPVGGGGSAEVLSFHATKVLSTFEGGAILTNDCALSERLKRLRNFGFVDYDHIVSLGINAKMTESNAAMGLASLDVVEERIVRLKRTHNLYKKCFKDIEGITMIEIDDNVGSNYHYAVLLVEEGGFGVSRDFLYKALWERNVFARRYFYPGCHRQKPYTDMYPDAYKHLPVTEDVSGKVLCLPTNLKNPEIDTVTIADIFKQVGGKRGN
jgi:dTDP-4-amino-4,6-dideoxygalactose transaminase